MSLPDERIAGGEAIVIVGAGLAGLFLALKLAPRRAIVLSRASLGQGAASAWAQGGLAAAFAAQDSPAQHAADTIAAGAGLVDPVAARIITEAAPPRVRDLLALGVPFDRSPEGALRQSLEAAHSFARVARVSGDMAGKAILDALIAAALAAEDRIRIIEGLAARALLQDESGAVRGVLAIDPRGKLIAVEGAETVLATGGAGGLWRVTTNPSAARGAGIAMAARAGALIGDPEFMQFHPTAIDVGRDPAPLATESLRGEGARLVDSSGAPFMQRYDPKGDLAPRDVVARAIHQQLRGGHGAFLDARDAVGAHFDTAFPTVFAACMSAGVDPRVAPIPVAPAAHYHMGGVVTDLWGQTTLSRLAAVGECSSTGAHGANRLASNSLLESVAFAQRIAERLRDAPAGPPRAAAAPPLPPSIEPAALARLRATMEDRVGVVRGARDRATALTDVNEAIAQQGLSDELLVAAFIAEGASRRLESRGAHYCPDHPSAAAQAKRTFLTLADLGDSAAAARTQVISA